MESVCYFLNQRLSGESADVNYKMKAEFHLAAFVSWSLCCARWLAVTTYWDT